MKYIIDDKSVKNHIVMTEPKSQYKLFYCTSPIQHSYQKLIFKIPYKQNEILVTGRDLSLYPKEITNLTIDPQKQYAEIGTGLSSLPLKILSQLKKQNNFS